MTKGIFGRKVGMTQIFNDRGQCIPVTVIQAEECQVVRHRTRERDGYEAIQVGYGLVKPRRVSKPVSGQYKAAGLSPMRHLGELRVEDPANFQVGTSLGVQLFSSGEQVTVVGTSKGRGFAGTIRRHHFSRGPMTHGSKTHRRPASAGATDAARVFPGKRSPGRMGGRQVSVKGLTVERVDVDRKLLLLRGAVPGARGSLVTVVA